LIVECFDVLLGHIRTIEAKKADLNDWIHKNLEAILIPGLSVLKPHQIETDT
jgi:hypothetical protein